MPPGVFGVARADAMARAVGAELVLTLDVSTAGPDPSIPALVAAQLPVDRVRGTRFELGNEVYDPRQGPPPNGYATAQQYLAAVAPVAAAVRAVGGVPGVVVGPCPLFYGGDDAPCWGGADGRYHQWQRNVSALYRAGCASAGGCPFDAVIAHNYVADLGTIALFTLAPATPTAPATPGGLLSAFLAMPEVTTAIGAATVRRDFPGCKLWISEFNVMYADVWGGKGDAVHPVAAAFLNSTENSGAHAVHVAAHVLAGAANADVVDQMSYHSLLARAGPDSLGPGRPTGSQPGFAIAALNATAGYISPVAQLLTMLAGFFRQPGARVQPLPEADSAPALPFTMVRAGLGNTTLPCMQAVAVCGSGGGGDRVLAINRCGREVRYAPTTPLCKRPAPGWPATGWRGGLVYNASLAAAGHDWAQLVGPSPSAPWAPAAVPAAARGGAPFPLPPHSFAVVEL